MDSTTLTIIIVIALVIIPQVIVIGRLGFLAWILGYLVFGSIIWYFTPWEGFWGWLASGYIASVLAAIGAIFSPLGPVGGAAAAGGIGYILGRLMGR